ncbi:MAG TPA: hypothetical protein VJ844_11030 [Mucilaginibacter sp.]|nr:hypothetical protein [Mucilaginibacter sp.]
MSTRYGTFLESYNSGNTYMDKVTKGFFDKISYDTKILSSNAEDPSVKNKFGMINEIANDHNKSSYDRVIAVANILDDGTLNSVHPDHKKNVLNVVYGLLDVAKSTEDSFLIDKSLHIASQIPDISG